MTSTDFLRTVKDPITDVNDKIMHNVVNCQQILDQYLSVSGKSFVGLKLCDMNLQECFSSC